VTPNGYLALSKGTQRIPGVAGVTFEVLASESTDVADGSTGLTVIITEQHDRASDLYGTKVEIAPQAARIRRRYYVASRKIVHNFWFASPPLWGDGNKAIGVTSGDRVKEGAVKMYQEDVVIPIQ